MKSYTTFQEIGLLALRLILAAIFIYAGSAKWFFWSAPMEGMPPIMINLMRLLSVVEPLGAVALLVGFLTTWAAAGLAIIMFGSLFFVYFLMHVGFFTSQQGTGMDYNVLILVGCIALIAFGGGSWSLDAVWKKMKTK